jgi:AP endonuclease-2
MSQFVKEIIVNDGTQTEASLPKFDTTTLLYSPYFKRTEKTNEEEKQVSVPGILVDSFRYIHPQQKDAFTNWCTSTGARLTNYGNRLDYILSDVLLVKQKFVDVIIRPEVEGSDHCPVVASLRGRISPSKRPPALCTRFMPEFAGKQQKLASYFTKKAVEISKDDSDAKAMDSEENSSQETTPKDQEEVPPEGKKYSSVKREANFDSNPQAKRAKTSQSVKKTNMFQFFGKKTTVKDEATVKGPDQRDSSSTCDEEKIEEKTVDSQSISNNGSTCGSKLNNDDQSDYQGSKSDISTNTIEPFESIPDSQNSTETTDHNRKAEVALWKNILKGPPPAPLCPGHDEPCVLRTVKKKGPNYGRQFHCCARPEGHYSNKEARCKFFKWTR